MRCTRDTASQVSVTARTQRRGNARDTRIPTVLPASAARPGRARARAAMLAAATAGQVARQAGACRERPAVRVMAISATSAVNGASTYGSSEAEIGLEDTH